MLLTIGLGRLNNDGNTIRINVDRQDVDRLIKTRTCLHREKEPAPPVYPSLQNSLRRKVSFNAPAD